MRKLTTAVLAVIFAVSLLGIASADRNALSMGGKVILRGVYEENLGAGGRGAGVGVSGMNNYVDQLIQLNIEADMTDNVSAKITLQHTGAWAGTNTGAAYAAIDDIFEANGNNLGIDQAYVTVKELIIQPLTVSAGVMDVTVSLRDNGRSMFVSLEEVGALKGTLDYDPLYVDIVIAKFDETANVAPVVAAGRTSYNDMDFYAAIVEYYYENDSKVQVILDVTSSESDDTSITEWALGADYKGFENWELFGQIGGQGGDVGLRHPSGLGGGGGADLSAMALNLGATYTFANVQRTPYVGLEYQSFSGDDDAGDVQGWVPTNKDNDATLLMESDANLRNAGGQILTSNYTAIRINAGCVIDEKTTLDGTIAIFSRYDDDSAVDGFTGAAANEDASLGTEIDLALTHQFTDDLETSLAVAYFAPGDAYDDLAGAGVSGDEAVIGMYATAALDF